MRRMFFLLCLLVALAQITEPPLVRAASVPMGTDWQLKPSLKYDALCILNVLGGDPFYLHYYQAEYDHFHPLFAIGCVIAS